jgi:hypothetical protein
MLVPPKELLEKLEKDSIHQQWIKSHPENFLTHFFCQLDNKFNSKSSWEIGFYDNNTKKISVFLEQNNQFLIKPEDDVFKKEADKIEGLKLDEIKIHVEKSIEIFKENFPKYFPQEIIGDGFLILQTIKDKTFWNFTYITKRLKFVNLKISVEDGSIESHETVDLVQKGPLEK